MSAQKQSPLTLQLSNISQNRFKFQQNLVPVKNIYHRKTEFQKISQNQKLNVNHKLRVMESINRIRSQSMERNSQHHKKDQSVTSMSLAYSLIQHRIVKSQNLRTLEKQSKTEISGISPQIVFTQTQDYTIKNPINVSSQNKNIKSPYIPVTSESQTLGVKVTAPMRVYECSLDSIDFDNLQQYNQYQDETIPEIKVEMVDDNNNKIAQCYMNNLDRLNIIKYTIGRCIEMLNAKNNVWMIPLALVYKRLVQLKSKLYQQLNQGINKFDWEQWNIFMGSVSQKELLEQIKIENQLDIKRLEEMLEESKKQFLKLPSSQKVRVTPLINSNMNERIKDVVFVYLYSQILARVEQIYQMCNNGQDISKQIEMKNKEVAENDEWLQLIILIQRSLIELEQGLQKQKDLGTFEIERKSKDRSKLRQIMLEQKEQIKQLKKKYEEDYDI